MKKFILLAFFSFFLFAHAKHKPLTNAPLGLLIDFSRYVPISEFSYSAIRGKNNYSLLLNNKCNLSIYTSIKFDTHIGLPRFDGSSKYLRMKSLKVNRQKKVIKMNYISDTNRNSGRYLGDDSEVSIECKFDTIEELEKYMISDFYADSKDMINAPIENCGLFGSIDSRILSCKKNNDLYNLKGSGFTLVSNYKSVNRIFRDDKTGYLWITKLGSYNTANPGIYGSKIDAVSICSQSRTEFMGINSNLLGRSWSAADTKDMETAIKHGLLEKVPGFRLLGSEYYNEQIYNLEYFVVNTNDNESGSLLACSRHNRIESFANSSGHITCVYK